MRALKLLIIDDDRDYAESLAQYLRLDGHEVHIEVSGRAGIAAGIAKDYDQIIVDFGLPDVNGLESLQAIRAARPDSRILLTTGYSADHLDRPVKISGSVEVLTKPLDLDSLSQRLAFIAGSGKN